MKKLGTPIGAGPGSESEKVGFDAWGTPFPVGPVVLGFGAAGGVLEPGLFDLAVFFFFFSLVGFCVVDPLWVDFCWLALGLVCLGDVELLLLVVVLLEVEVELEVAPELEVEVEVDEGVEVLLEDVLLDVVGVLVVVLLLVVVVELGDVVVELEVGVQDSDSLTNGPLIGSDIAEAGVPGGTSTWNDLVTPPDSVTVTVHGSADAVGSAPSDKPTKAAAVIASTPRSLRSISNVAYLSHKTSCAALTRRPDRERRRSY